MWTADGQSHWPFIYLNNMTPMKADDTMDQWPAIGAGNGCD